MINQTEVVISNKKSTTFAEEIFINFRCNHISIVKERYFFNKNRVFLRLIAINIFQLIDV